MKDPKATKILVQVVSCNMCSASKSFPEEKKDDSLPQALAWRDTHVALHRIMR